MQPTPSQQGSTPLNGDMLRGGSLRKFNFYLQIDEQPTEEAAIDKDLLQITDEELFFKNEAGKRIDAQACNIDSRSASFVDTTSIPLLNAIQ